MMDFQQVMGFLVRQFAEQRVEYAVIGGFALGAWGIQRGTMDIDLLINARDLPTVDAIMAAHLYRLRHRTENVSQFVADVKPLGSIDLLHAFRAHALAMLQRARRLPFFETRLQIPVAIPEDLMGLKLQAMRNNPSRQPLEIADIHLLMRQCAATMDWELAEHYFVLFGQQQLFQELRTIYHAVD